VFIDLMESAEHRAEIVRSDGDHRGETDGGGHRVSSSDPIPKLEHVFPLNAELCDQLSVR
jgi:hypothetical protein